MRLCIHDRCITWPRFVGTILGMNFGCLPTTMQNRWYQITGHGFNEGNMPGWVTNFGRHSLPQNVASEIGTAPVYNDITGTTGKLIRYFVRNNADLGKKIKIYGLGYGNQPLQEQVGGIWEDGITIAAAVPPVGGTHVQLVTKITSVVREATSGMSYLFAYDSTALTLQDLAQYEPSETNPRYRRTSIDGWCNNAGCTKSVFGHIGGTSTDITVDDRYVQVEALVKLQFIPAVNENDFLFIDVEPALKLAMQAVKLEEQNQDEDAATKWLLAIQELNMEDRDKLPNNQTVVVESVINGGAMRSPC